VQSHYRLQKFEVLTDYRLGKENVGSQDMSKIFVIYRSIPVLFISCTSVRDIEIKACVSTGVVL
jgi:hypothetical protein